MKTDCLIIGFNDGNFEDYVDLVRMMGADSGAFKDLDLAFIEFNNKLYRSMDLLNHFRRKNNSGAQDLHNSDFLWPVITYLGSYLAKRGFSFDYVNLFHLEKDKLKEKLLSQDILTIAITTTLYVSPHPILEIMSFIKQYNESAKVVIGGPYISNQAKMLDPESLKSLFEILGADYYVINSEGEAALANLLYSLKNGLNIENVNNIAFKKDDDFLLTAASVEQNELEKNPIDYSLFPREEFGEFISLRTAKSCPFACAFCGFPQRAGSYTYMGVDFVEKELNAIRDIGTVTTLTFLDDTFNVPKGRFKDLLRMMIKNAYGFKWNSFYRSDHGDQETIALMAKAGCEGVFLGIESASDRMLQKMNKTASRKDYLKAVPMLRDAGITTHANLIIGFPGETDDTVEETISFIDIARPDFFRAQLWYCDPTTPIWNQREKYGVTGSAFNWAHDTMDFRAACAWIDKIFLSVDSSTWLPQMGFEDWSLYYLQRKGMTIDQIKTFVTRFNALVKRKITDPYLKEPDPILLQQLAESCRFDEPLRIGA